MRRTVIVALAALGFSLAALSVAWACTSDASMYVSNYNPMPGEVIRATGEDYYAGMLVELRWGAETGPVVAQARAVEIPGETFVEDNGAVGNFAVDVPIPADAAPGDTILYAVPSRGEGQTDARVAPVRLTIPGEVTDEVSQPTDEVSQPTDEVTEPASGAPGAFTPAPDEVQVLTGANQAVAADAAPQAAPQDEGESAPAPAVNTDWRNTHGALLHVEATPVMNTDWRSTHGALLHAVPDSLEGSDRGAFADAVAASEANGYTWTGAFRGDGPLGMGAGLALFAPGLMLLFGGFTVATVARRREKVPVTDQ